MKKKVLIRLDKHKSLRAYDKHNRQVNVVWRYVSFDKFKVTIYYYDSEGYVIAGGSNEANLTIDELDEYLEKVVKGASKIEIY